MWGKEEFERISGCVDDLREEAVELASRLVSFEAVPPESGGQGEYEKARFLWEYLKERRLGDLRWYEAKDERVSSGVRPSIVLSVGEGSPRLWIMSHLDVVPAGARELWETDPFKAVVKDGRIYGRGAEDNNQAIVSSVMALRAVREAGFAPRIPVRLLFVADEETGSNYGLKFLLREHNLFGEGDLVLVPDGGAPDGTMIEVAEKTIAWLRFKVLGKQSHGSRPDRGVNAARASAYLITSLDEALHRAFPQKNALFAPPESTFEPTKHEANVDNINTIPGEEVFYFDCRILPEVGIEEFEAVVRRVCVDIEKRFGVRVEWDYRQRQVAAPPTPEDAPIVLMLKEAVKEVYGVEAKAMGIGGGTVAAILRDAGIPAAVWAKLEETAHQPNEFCVIENLLGDAKVMAYLMGGR
ncbi:MAG: diaminopimelate aminotransferase [Planctomycetota bacterium]|nr:MAG: diaminopimelate aminotransferase [Planctomycetota bacterium]